MGLHQPIVDVMLPTYIFKYTVYVWNTQSSQYNTKLVKSKRYWSLMKHKPLWIHLSCFDANECDNRCTQEPTTKQSTKTFKGYGHSTLLSPYEVFMVAVHLPSWVVTCRFWFHITMPVALLLNMHLDFVTWHIAPQQLQQDLDNKSTTVLLSTDILIDIPLQKLRDAQIYRARCWFCW